MTEEYTRVKSMWVAVAVTWLLYQLHIVLVMIFRSNALSSIRKSGYGRLATASTAAGVGTQGEEGALVNGMHGVDTVWSSWLLRARHSLSVLRDTLITVVVLTLLAQLVFNRGVPQFDDGAVGVSGSASVYYPFVFVWVILALSLLQWTMAFVVGPMILHGVAMSYYGPGLYASHDDRNEPHWLDPICEAVKFVLVFIAVILAFIQLGGTSSSEWPVITPDQVSKLILNSADFDA